MWWLRQGLWRDKLGGKWGYQIIKIMYYYHNAQEYMFMFLSWRMLCCGKENGKSSDISLPFHLELFLVLNPLMPVAPVTPRDERWPFFLFWCHPFWPKLASSILNFCRRKKSFQWCPDQSDQPNGTLDMHKNTQKVEWKTWSKISCHYTWMLHAKISHLNDGFSEVF